MKIFLAAAALAFIAGSAVGQPIDPVKPDDPASAILQRNMMLGHWYGESRTKDGGRRLEIAEHRRDGTMTIRFRVIDAKGKVEEQTEVALWGISGPVYFTITRGWLDGTRFHAADPTQAYYYDAYEILELTRRTFRYRHVTTGSEYRLDRVAAGFDFPD